MPSRGIRNNNPGNIRHSQDKWQGAAKEQPDESFVTFTSAVWGIRAVARILISYQDKYGCDTVAKHIARWAPPSENDTKKYARFVADHVGIGVDETFDIYEHDFARPMVEAIIDFENDGTGCPYSDVEMDKAMALAGIEPPSKSLQSSRTVKGGQVAGLAGVVTAASGIAAQIAPALPVISFIRDNLAFALMAVGACVLIGVGYMVWARIEDKRRLIVP